jgi:hypothetical protein
MKKFPISKVCEFLVIIYVKYASCN